MVNKGNHPQPWPYFRLVKYYNLRRIMGSTTYQPHINWFRNPINKTNKKMGLRRIPKHG
jgi:hypothetical protein